VANPLAAILTLGVMLDHIGYPEANTRIFEAVKSAVQAYKVPRDLGGDCGTKETGDAIVEYLRG
jgi:isocitrate/isopropylmalate dehydrogenase